MILRRNCRPALNVMLCVKWALLLVLLLVAIRESLAGDLYVSPGGLSLHQDRRAGYNEVNNGLSATWKTSAEFAFSAGGYGNSLHRRSYFAAARWTPVQVFKDTIRAGVLVGVVDGYAANGGRAVPVALPAVAADVGPVEITVMAWPAMFGSGAGIAAHFSVRVW